MQHTSSHGVDHREDTTTGEILHWYDLTCPFCYLAQARNQIFLDHDLVVVELPFQAHPEIPPDGMYIGPRSGPRYEMIAQEAERAGLPLSWPDRLPNSRRALAAAEWVRRSAAEHFPAYQKTLFHAHFAAHEDLGDNEVLILHAAPFGIDALLKEALEADAIFDAVAEAERSGRLAGVNGTPAWLIDGHLISGLQSPEQFERIAATVASLGRS